eukprot:CAMPEP_0116133112 /NCGR_PEP_ID=MMETSP0329-20121206/9930_1 /TAXON_ID=697910 /ORGANISM="Pseudo-nitzschia arenysensis, Strain B593" /LENGTH=238 /DNA_ID=CAMNT_0003627717 /DNA_START=212 /DNA_END=928 /DNA_ORIENTATION=-
MGSSSKRPDGRSSAATLRPLSCELSCLQRPDGSALWKAGSTHVLAAVYGPVAPMNPQMEENLERAHVSVVVKSGNSACKDYEQNELSEFLTLTLAACIDADQFPRCIIEVVLQIIQNDGSLLAGLLHAGVAALMDAGVDLLYLPVATTCLVSSCSNIVLDPTSAEEEQDRDSSVICVINQEQKPDEILASHTVGSGTSLDDLLKCLQIASKACSAIPAFWRLAMEQKVNRESQTLWSR